MKYLIMKVRSKISFMALMKRQTIVELFAITIMNSYADMQKGGIIIQATDPFTSQTVEVKGTRRMLPNKSKKATWY